jgi:hypothetical protein
LNRLVSVVFRRATIEYTPREAEALADFLIKNGLKRYGVQPLVRAALFTKFR